MALNIPPTSGLAPLCLSSASLATLPSRLFTTRFAVVQPAARRRYWAWRGSKRGYSPAGHDATYYRHLRYRLGRHDPGSPDSSASQPASSPARLCNSWTKRRRGHSSKDVAEDAGKEEDASAIERDMRAAFMRHCRQVAEPVDWDAANAADAGAQRRQLERILRREPYLSLFGGSELRGAWNPWAEDGMVRSRGIGIVGGPEISWTEAGSAGTKGPENPQMSRVARAKAKPQASGDGEYTFDPISMRKIRVEAFTSPESPKSGSKQPQTEPPEGTKAAAAKQGDEDSSAISFKPPPTRMTDLGKEEIEALKPKPAPMQPDVMGFARQPWLSKEWTQMVSSRSIPRRRVDKGVEESAPLQSSLDRMAAAPEDAVAAKKSPEDTAPTRPSASAKNEDLPKQPPRAPLPNSQAPTKAESRAKLDKEYFASQARFDEDLSTVQKPRAQQKHAEPAKSTPRESKPKPHPKAMPASGLASEISDEFNMASKWVKRSLTEALEAFGEARKLLREAKDEAFKLSLDEEVTSQKAAMSAFENKPRQPTTTTTQNSSPVAEKPRTKPEDSKEKEEKRQRDKDLVQEIRNIYEERYGKISTEHRQPPANAIEEEPVVKSSDTESAAYPPSQGQDTVSDFRQDTRAPSAVGAQTESRDTNRWLASSSPFAVDKPPHPRPNARPVDSESARLNSAGAHSSATHPSIPLPNNARVKPTAADDVTPQPPAAQPSAPPSAALVSAPPRPAPPPRLHRPRKQVVYKVLAYDPARDEVSAARTSSSLYERSQSLQSPSWILSHLDAPHKYLDAMETLEATGYELVAGDRRMLVYRRVRPEEPEADERRSRPAHREEPEAEKPKSRPARPGDPEAEMPAKPSSATARAASAVPPASHEAIPALKEHPTAPASASQGSTSPALAAIQREDVKKMQRLQGHLRRLEKQQRGMEFSSNAVANRVKALEHEIQRLLAARPGELAAAAGARRSRLRRVARFLFRLPLLVVRVVAAVVVLGLCLFVTAGVAAWLYETLLFRWRTGRWPRMEHQRQVVSINGRSYGG